MKAMCSKARQLRIATSFYSLARGSRTAYCVKEDSWSRVRGAGSEHQVFGRGAVSSAWAYYVWELRGFLCLAFFVVLLLCNLNKIL